MVQVIFSAILGLIPSIVSGIVTAYTKSKDVSIAAIQSAGSIASAQAQAMSLWIGHPLSPPSVMAYAVALYYAKAIAFDNVVAFWIWGEAGFTPAIRGETAYVAMLIVSGMFFSGIARIVRGGQ
jgi:hypothetical protein